MILIQNKINKCLCGLVFEVFEYLSAYGQFTVFAVFTSGYTQLTQFYWYIG